MNQNWNFQRGERWWLTVSKAFFGSKNNITLTSSLSVLKHHFLVRSRRAFTVEWRDLNPE